MTKVRNQQVGKSPYKNLTIEPIDFIVKNKLDWHEGNMLKYLCRHKIKNQAEDIKKCIHYAQMLLEDQYGIQSEVHYIDKTKKTKRKYIKKTSASKETKEAI